MSIKSARVLVSVAVAAALSGVGSASAADFSITSGTSNTARTLNAGETGSVSAGATLSVSSGNSITLGATNGLTTIVNSGSILETGTGRVVRNNTSGTPAFSITNNSTGLIQAADADTIRADIAGSSWTLNNSGRIISLNPSLGGSQAIDFDAVTTGNVQITNAVGGLIQANAADAIRTGANAVVMNFGTIQAFPQPDPTNSNFLSSSDGIDTQARSGVQITNGGLISGRHGVTGGPADANTDFAISVTNTLGGTLQGVNGSGINIDGFNAKETATITNGGLIVGRGADRGDLDRHDGDGIDVDGLVNLTNTGTIRSLNAFNFNTIENSEGISAGGGFIENSGTIEGLVEAGNTHAIGIGISIVGNDTATPGVREAFYGNTTIINHAGGLIRGQSAYGINVGTGAPASGFNVTITNEAGATIQGGGATFAAIQTGADGVTINNAGTIDGSSSGMAINFGAGNNALNIFGGNILGNINGGTGHSVMLINAGAGNTFAYSGAISNFDTVQVTNGTVRLSGGNTYTGTTLVSGGRLVLDGVNRISSASALVLSGGTLEVDASGANGQTFASFELDDTSTIDLGSTTSLTFGALSNVATGKTLSILNWDRAVSPDYAIRFAGDLSSNLAFLTLVSQTTIGGLAAQFVLDGLYTDVRPVPVPAAFGLLLSAFGMLGAFRRRQATV